MLSTPLIYLLKLGGFGGFFGDINIQMFIKYIPHIWDFNCDTKQAKFLFLVFTDPIF